MSFKKKTLLLLAFTGLLAVLALLAGPGIARAAFPDWQNYTVERVNPSSDNTEVDNDAMNSAATEAVSNAFLKPAISSLHNSSNDILRSISVDGLLTQDMENIIPGGASLVRAADYIRNTLIEPVASSVLTLVLIVQLIKVSRRVDQSDPLPGVTEIMEIIVVFAIISRLISMSEGIVDFLFSAGRYFASLLNSFMDSEATTALPEFDTISVPDYLTALIGYLVVWLFAIFAAVVATASVYIRAIQIYVYSMFAPIPISLLSFEQTRSMGISFLRSFAALSLTSVILIFILNAFPFIVSGAIEGMTTDASMLWIPKIIGACCALIWSLFNVGSWAQQALGT